MRGRQGFGNNDTCGLSGKAKQELYLTRHDVRTERSVTTRSEDFTLTPYTNSISMFSHVIFEKFDFGTA